MKFSINFRNDCQCTYMKENRDNYLPRLDPLVRRCLLYYCCGTVNFHCYLVTYLEQNLYFLSDSVVVVSHNAVPAMLTSGLMNSFEQHLTLNRPCRKPIKSLFAEMLY